MSFHKVTYLTQFKAGVDVVGNVAVSGTVDGRDVALDGSNQDTHIADATLHRVINDAGTSATELWSASKISTELTGKSDTGHTHTASEVTDFSSAADARIALQKGAVNGIAELDGTGKIPTAQLPALAITDVSVVADITARNALTPVEGDVAKVTDGDGLGHPATFIYDGSSWIDIQETSDVISVNGATGVVTLTTTNVAEGTNLYYTELRVSANADVAAAALHILDTANPHSVTKAQVGLTNVLDTKVNIAASVAPTATDDSSGGYSVGSVWIDTTADKAYVCVDSTAASAVWQQLGVTAHGDLSDIGSNTHAQIDTHISDTTNPHSVTKTQVGLSEVPNLKVNLAASVAPVLTDDTSSNYSIGSIWIDTTADKGYVCVDNAAAAAVWVETTQSAAAAALSMLGSATYGTIQEENDLHNSAGWTTGGAITDAGGEQIDVALGTGMIRATASAVDTLFYFDWAASAGLAIPTDTTRFVGIQYNAGTPNVVIKTSNTWDFHTDWPLGRVINEGGTLHIIDQKFKTSNTSSLIKQRLAGTHLYEKDQQVGGLVLGETGTRNVTYTAGQIWSMLQSYVISAFDTSAASVFATYHDDGSSGWTKTPSQTQWPNTKYDDGSGTLATLNSDKYGVLWFYVDVGDNHTNMIYGTVEYSTAVAAEAATPPSTLPNALIGVSVLLGRIVFQESGSTATLIQTTFGSNVELGSGTTASNHNNLDGLQGGAAGDYYHMTSAELTATNSHVGDATLHRVINDAGTSATELWSASKISTELTGKSATGHTHTASEVTDFSTEVDARITLQKGAVNGLAELDGTGKVPTAQLPALAITDVSVVADITARNALTPAEGDVAKVIDGDGLGHPATFIYDGSSWIDIQETSDVISVNGATGVVTLTTTNVAEGTNLYYTELRVSANADVAAAALHILDTANPHSVTKAQVGLTNVVDTKVNFAASVAPTATDDSGSGYSVGSVWIDTTADKSYTCVDATAASAVWVLSSSLLAHGDLTGIGTYTHAQIDTHIDDATKHRIINDAGTSATELWSADKINTVITGLTTTDVAEGTGLYYTEIRVSANADVAAAALHLLDTANPHSVTKAQVGLTNVLDTKVNSGSSSPAPTDDSSGGYSVGSRWINTSTDVEYVCLDSTVANAIWKRTVEEENGVVEFFDDFIGADISLLWVTDTQGTLSDSCIVDGIGGQVELKSDATATDFSQLSFSTKTVNKATNTCVKFRLKQSDITQSKIEIGSILDASNLVRFVYDKAGSGGNWDAETISGGTNTTSDTTFVADTSWNVFEIQYTTSRIKFFINDVLKVTSTTNLPSGLMNVYIRQTSNSTSTRTSLVDFVKITGDREA